MAIPPGKLAEMQRAVKEKADTQTLALLRQHPGLLDARLDPSGRTPLMWAAHTGRCNNVRALLRAGAAVEIQTNSGATAAWYAAAANKPTALRILLRNGADPLATVREEPRGKVLGMYDVAM